ncbi:MAG: ComF family protein, partial [Bilophila sp.]
GECLSHPPPWEHFRFFGSYSGALKTLMLRGKFGADPAALRLLGHFLALACADLPVPDAIVPVPLHVSRLRERGFNQSQELARPLAERLGIPLMPHLLRRQIATRHQVGLSRDERRANLTSAFAASQEARGKRILLIDDTFTTGTTLRKAAQALLAVGQSNANERVLVDVAVVARTVREPCAFQNTLTLLPETTRSVSVQGEPLPRSCCTLS